MNVTDEHEMLIQYSEMTAFDFNSEEFQKIREDYIECKNFAQRFVWKMGQFFSKMKPAETV